jgi:hypothetical protein
MKAGAGMGKMVRRKAPRLKAENKYKLKGKVQRR